MFVNLWQPENANIPMDFTLLGMVIDFKFIQSANA